MPINTNINLVHIADDTLVFTKNRNTYRSISQLQKQLNSLQVLHLALTLQFSKTVTVLFKVKHLYKHSHIIIDNFRLQWSNQAKCLGVIYDKNLCFRVHLKEAIRKATRIRGMLYPVIGRKSPIPISTKSQLYCIYIRSVLIYPAWGPLLSKSNWRAIKVVQNIALRLMHKSNYSS